MDNLLKSSKSFASILNPVESSKKIWFSKPKNYESIAGNISKRIREEIKYNHPPMIGNFSLSRDQLFMIYKISKQHKLRLNIPETLVFGYGFSSPTFFYTGTDGVLNVKTHLKPCHIETIFKIFQVYRQNTRKLSPIPLAIVKSIASGTARMVMKTSDLILEIDNCLRIGTILQRYVVPRGSKAFKIRVFCKDSGHSYYFLCNKLRFDGKEERKPKFPKKEPEKSIEKFELVAEKSESFVKLNVEKPVRGLNDIEVIENGQRMESDKKFAMSLVELGSFEITDKFIKQPRKVKIDRPLSSVQVFKESKKEVNELDMYFAEVIEDVVPIEQSLDELYLELESSASKTNFLNMNSEEGIFSNFIIYRVKSLFLIDTYSYETYSISKVNSKPAFFSLEKTISSLKKYLNYYFLAKDSEHIEDFVLEFCEDYEGTYYFLEIKSFTKKNHVLVKAPSAAEKEKFICPGKFCKYQETPNEEVSRNLENHPKVFKILYVTLKGDAEQDIQKVLKLNYDKTVNVCEDCFKVYMKIEKTRIKSNTKDYNDIDVCQFRFFQSIGKVKERPVSKNLKISKKYRNSSSLKLSRKRKELIQAARFSEFTQNK